ncbi:J domain-containing protein [Natronoglycomyces albus]|uniref:J domain-containing protein n=1 Tax=Natronoglycomyces albus TaxID=2811108 RepID=A0A895XT02_9ACTN|nr:J domain-containing protein [Natronoglycomyces albus]QSB06782.1 J domain-containing protein [Natronoglycomyces albus]
MSEPDHYRTLHITPEADPKTIRSAYLRRLHETHPDAGGTTTEFHAVQTAWETLSNPSHRREYDLAQYGKRAARRYGKTHTRSKHRRPHSWRINPTTKQPPTNNPTTTELIALPWHARIHKNRLTHTPSLLTRTSLAAGAILTWIATAILYTHTLLTHTHGALLHATAIPLLSTTAILITYASTRPATPKTPKTGPILTGLATLTMLYLTSASPIGITFTLHALACLAVPWTIRRLRLTIQLRATIKPALTQYNAFAPPGQQPRADRATGALLRELLTHIPSARLFAAVPTTTGHHADYLILAGNRAAIIASPIPRHPHDATPETLPDIINELRHTLPDTHIRGWIIWPTLPDDRIISTETTISHLPTNQAASDIGTWLTPQAHHLHLPTLRRLRDRLTAIQLTPTQPDTSPV